MTCTCNVRQECFHFFQAVSDQLHQLWFPTTAKGKPQPDRIVPGVVQNGDCFCDMPGTCGPTAWALFHGVADSFRAHVCEECGEEGVRLMSFLHDAVNMKLGKPLHDPANYRRTLDAIIERTGPLVCPDPFPICGSETHAAAPKIPLELLEVVACPIGIGAGCTTTASLSPEAIAGLPREREIGFSVCERDGRLEAQGVAVGEEDRISLKAGCPEGGRLLAVTHTHPSPSHGPGLSDADLRNMLAQGVPECVVHIPSATLTCERPKGFL